MTKNCDIVLWCEHQSVDEDGIFCTAHVHEARVFNCPYENSTKRLEAEHPCSDYGSIPDTVTNIY